jgi:hypothetical protein
MPKNTLLLIGIDASPTPTDVPQSKIPKKTKIAKLNLFGNKDNAQVIFIAFYIIYYCCFYYLNIFNVFMFYIRQ